jgi:hypothetical protein
LQYELFSPENPFILALSPVVTAAQKSRQPVSQRNSLWQTQEWFGTLIEACLDGYRDIRDRSCERLFQSVYGSPILQALVGLKASQQALQRKPAEDAVRSAWVHQRMRELTDSISNGGAREAVVRALLYIRLPEGVVDERGFNLMRTLREDAGEGMSLAEFKKMLREQFFMLLLNDRKAIDAVPIMLDREPELAARMGLQLRQMIDAVGVHGIVAKQRVQDVEAIFANFVERHGMRKSKSDERQLQAVGSERDRNIRGAKHA